MDHTPTVEEQLAELRAVVARLETKVAQALRLVDMIPNPAIRKLVKSTIGGD